MDARDAAAGSGRGGILHAAGGNMMSNFKNQGDVYGLNQSAQLGQAAQGASGGRHVLSVSRLNLSNTSD